MNDISYIITIDPDTVMFRSKYADAHRDVLVARREIFAIAIDLTNGNRILYTESGRSEIAMCETFKMMISEIMTFGFGSNLIANYAWRLAGYPDTDVDDMWKDLRQRALTEKADAIRAFNEYVGQSQN